MFTLESSERPVPYLHADQPRRSRLFSYWESTGEMTELMFFPQKKSSAGCKTLTAALGKTAGFPPPPLKLRQECLQGLGGFKEKMREIRKIKLGTWVLISLEYILQNDVRSPTHCKRYPLIKYIQRSISVEERFWSSDAAVFLKVLRLLLIVLFFP